MSPAGKRHVPRDPGSLHAVYPGCSATKLYTAALNAATALGFVIIRRDDARTAFLFRAPGPVGSWPTDGMIAVIRPAADGARIVIGAEHLTGYRLDALDWHQANAIGLMLLDRMKSVLPGIPEPATGAPPVRSTADELETLAELRDRGLLTEDEYTAEKNKLLS